MSLVNEKFTGTETADHFTVSIVNVVAEFQFEPTVKHMCDSLNFCSTFPSNAIVVFQSSRPSQQEYLPLMITELFVFTKRVRPQPLYLFCNCGERLVHRQQRSLIQTFHNSLDQIHDMVE